MTLQPRFSFPALLVSLVGLLLLPEPLVELFPALFGASLTLVLISSLYLVTEDRRHLIIGLGLALPALLISWWPGIEQYSSLSLLNDVLYGGFLIFISIRIFSYMLAANRVTLNMLYAAVCQYLIIGLIWAFVYSLIARLSGEAFTGALQYSDGYAIRDLMYFSYITLTTVGYGDILPVSSAARSWAMMEGIVGQFYLAIIMARLVSLYSRQGPGAASE
ncbi:MAG: potassium channel family protein [Pseudomonadales bacterium]